MNALPIILIPLTLIGVIVAVLVFATETPWDRGYRQGQIDAANGIWKYELVDQPNGEKTWEKKPD